MIRKLLLRDGLLLPAVRFLRDHTRSRVLPYELSPKSTFRSITHAPKHASSVVVLARTTFTYACASWTRGRRPGEQNGSIPDRGTQHSRGTRPLSCAPPECGEFSEGSSPPHQHTNLGKNRERSVGRGPTGKTRGKVWTRWIVDSLGCVCVCVCYVLCGWPVARVYIKRSSISWPHYSSISNGRESMSRTPSTTAGHFSSSRFSIL